MDVEVSKKLNHYDLCKLTAEHFIKDFHLVIFEYQTLISYEHPDVLCFKDYSVLFEIKMSRQDFLKDAEKDCRVEKQIKYFTSFKRNRFDKINGIKWEQFGMQEFFQQSPHLGKLRYYVCEKDLISPDEIHNGFGLYYFNNGKFRKVKDSKTFKRDLYKENQLLSHAFRNFGNGNSENILVTKF